MHFSFSSFELWYSPLCLIKRVRFVDWKPLKHLSVFIGLNVLQASYILFVYLTFEDGKYFNGNQCKWIIRNRHLISKSIKKMNIILVIKIRPIFSSYLIWKVCFLFLLFLQQCMLMAFLASFNFISICNATWGICTDAIF